MTKGTLKTYYYYSYLKGDKMLKSKRINQYSGLKDIAISIKFDLDELEELMDYREAAANDKTLGKFFYQLMLEVKATEKLTEKRYLVG